MKSTWESLVRRRLVSKILLVIDAIFLITLMFNQSTIMLFWLAGIILFSALNVYSTFQLLFKKQNSSTNIETPDLDLDPS